MIGPGPLDGVRVLDLGGEMGGYGTRLLGELGADVIKIEPPAGDRQRRRPPLRAGIEGPEASLVFAYYQAGKRGITLDAGRDEAVPLLTELAAGADAVVLAPSKRTPVAGLDRAARALSWASTTAVVVCLTPYGLDGPLRDLRATHFTSYAMGGLMKRMGTPDGEPVAVPYQQMHDQLAMQAAVAVLAGLRDRPVAGGQFVELSLHELLGAQDDQLDRYAASFEIAGRTPARQAPPTGVWQCLDGEVELLVHNPPHWRGVVRLLGSPPELADPALDDRGERLARGTEIAALVGPRLLAMRVDEVVERGQKLGIPCAAVNSPAGFVEDPQPRARGYWRRAAHPVLGTIRTPGDPFRSAPALLTHRRRAPLLGEHNTVVYCGELGHEPAELAAWREDGLV
ncbi:CoA transferase [Actinoplanes sp. NPDC026619]|uniref:CaiB/BaiF CoA transferase family protein n=1 Tax=Actinoplanes sp. NPDC026619 TaxID=3155798 RepID=UPI0033F8013E